MLKLSNTTKRLLNSSNEAKGKLADLFGKSPVTISRWIAEDNVALTATAAVNFYKEGLHLTDAEIFEPQTATA